MAGRKEISSRGKLSGEQGAFQLQPRATGPGDSGRRGNQQIEQWRNPSPGYDSNSGSPTGTGSNPIAPRPNWARRRPDPGPGSTNRSWTERNRMELDKSR